MKTSLMSAAVSALVAVAFATPASATIVHDELISGDLSNSGAAPTSLAFAPGDNWILGTTGRDTQGVVDRDYFTFTLLADEYLTAITVLNGTTTVANGLAFIALEAGSQVTVDPAAPTAGPLLGWYHYGPGDILNDILPEIGAGAGAQGFTPPLGPGTYAVWIQETGTGTANYGFNFVVAEVPEPGTWAMMLLGFVAVGWALRPRPDRLAAAAA